MNLFDLFAKISLDTSDYEKGIKSSQSSLKQFGNSFGAAIKTTANLTKEITNVGATAAKVFSGLVTTASGGIAALGKIGIEYNNQIEAYTTNFTTMLGDAKQAAEKVEEIKTMAAKTPFGMDELAGATQTLLAFGIENEKTTEILQQLGDISLGDKEKLQSLTLAFSQATSAGKLAGQDLLQMINAGFNPLSQLVDKTGLSVGQLKELMGGLSKSATKAMLKTEGLTDYGRKLIEQGYISAEDLAYSLDVATRKGGQFYNGMEAASKTVSGLISTLKDDATALVGEVFQPANDILKNSLLPNALEYVATLSEAYGKHGLEGLIDGAADIFGEIVLESTKQAPKLVRTSTETVKQIIGAVKERKSDIRKAALTLFSELTGAFTETVDETLPLIEEFVPDIAEGLLEYGGLMFETGGKIIMSVVNGLSSRSGELSSKLVSVVKNGLSFVDLNAEDLSDGALNISTALVTALGDNLPDFVDTGLSIIGKIGQSFTSEDGKQKIHDMVSSLVMGFCDVLDSVDADDVSGAITTSATLIDTIFDSLFSDENKERIQNSILDATEEILDGVIASLPTLWELICKWGEQGDARSKALVKEFLEDALEFGTVAFGLQEDGWLRELLEVLSDPNEAIKESMGKGTTETADATDYVKEAGKGTDNYKYSGAREAEKNEYTVNINVYGVDDPLTLAEQTAIELERMKARRNEAGG